MSTLEQSITYNQLSDSILNDRLTVVKDFLADGGNPNTEIHGKTILMFAAEHGKAESAEVLLSAGANPNVIDESVNGWTALMWAAWVRDYDGCGRMPSTEHAEVAKVLLSAGADVNMKGKGGNTALMWAAWWGDPEVIKAILAGNPYLNEGNARGETALLRAIEAASQGVVREDDNEGIKVLLSAGVDVNVADVNGWTALMTAAWSGNVEVVKFLLSAGANLNAVNKDGETVLDCARPGIARLLEEAKAE